jgi:glutamate/aspartate transport system substrate-binding protein
MHVPPVAPRRAGVARAARLAAGVAVAVAALPALAGPVLDRIARTGQVTIAYRESSVPFSYLDASRRPVGYSIDLCQRFVEAIARRLAMKSLAIAWVPVTSATRVDTIAAGRADLECESTTNTAERRRQVAFTVPHYITGARYAVRADSPVAQLSDFRDRVLVSTAGTSPLAAARAADREFGIGIRIGEVPEHLRGIEMVESGQADGFVMDEVLLAGLISTRPNPAKLRIVGKYLTIEPLAIMLPRDDPEFKRTVDDEMKRLIRSGDAAALHDRWFLRPIPPNGRTLGLPMPYLLRDFWKFPSDWVPQ